MIVSLHCCTESISAPAYKKIRSISRLALAGNGKMKSVKDATQEDDPLR
jgi:hypothetical protein